MTPVSEQGEARRDLAHEEAGRLAYAIKRAFRDLTRITGFEDARASVAEIINTEADRRKPT